MIAIDVSPLVWMPRTGVARALDQLLLGWSRRAAAEPVILLAPAPIHPSPYGLPLQCPRRALPSPRAFRRRLPALVQAVGADAFLSPWSAFPALPVSTAVVVHEVPFARHGALEGRVRAARHRTWLRRNARDCQAVIVPSRATARDVLALHPGLADRLHVIPNGFDPDPWRRSAERAPGDDGAVLMIGVGRGRHAARKKGLDVLRAAWRGPLADARDLVVVGRPALPVPAGTRVVPDADETTLHALLAAAAVLVYPSRSEGFGYPPLEAMAAGVPVVTSDAGAIPEVVRDAARVVPAGDADALHDALAAVLASSSLRASLAAAGRKRARAFPPETSSERVEAVLCAAREAA